MCPLTFCCLAPGLNLGAPLAEKSVASWDAGSIVDHEHRGITESFEKREIAVI